LARRVIQRTIIGISFLFFSSVLVINNTTQLLQTWGIQMSSSLIFLISMLGMFGSAVWAIVLASMGEFK